jgi:hypothetical protein
VDHPVNPYPVGTVVVEREVFPPNATASRVVGITEQLTDANGGVREDKYERAVAGRLQRRVANSLFVA